MLDRPIVEISNLKVAFQTRAGPVSGVEDISFDIRAGETLCVVGESGSGKSVTSLSLMRLVEFGGGQITGGRILLDQKDAQPLDLTRRTPRQMRRLRGQSIGMIFQEPMTALNPVFTVGRQLIEAIRTHGCISRRAAREKALQLLQDVCIPEPEKRLRQYPHELSGGMRQRVGIAMALSCAPRLLIADEPTTALDVTTQAEILSLIKRLQRDHEMAVLFITHDMAVVAQMADRVVVMKDGRKVEEGGVQQIFAAPQEDYTKTLLAAVPRLGSMAGTKVPKPMPIPGAPLIPRTPPVVHPDQAPLLQVKGLVTRFTVRSGLLRRVTGQIHAVQDVSFTLQRGRTLALVGESGCGKSSVGRSLLRLTEPQRGEVHLDGLDVTGMDVRSLQQARRSMQMIFQDPFASLDPRLKLSAQVGEPLKNYRIGTPVQQRARVVELFDRAQLPQSYLDRYPHELSGGQRQRVAIARALALNPELIVADEAVSALDVSIQAQILNLLMELQADLGLSYLFISHDMAVVERISHEVAVMYLGRIVEKGPRAAIFENPRHPYTRDLLRAVPVADPMRPALDEDVRFAAVPSPLHPVGYEPAPNTYVEVGPGHMVLTSDCGYEQRKAHAR